MSCRVSASLLAALGLLAVTANRAGACDCLFGPAEPAVVAGEAVVSAPYYLVVQGPTYSGPGLTVTRSVYAETPDARGYPYVHLHATDSAVPRAGVRRRVASGPAPARPAVIRARAELHYISPTRMDIRLYRDR